MRVMVTGGAGFIGSHIVDQLIDSGDEVLIVDNMSTGKVENVHRRADLVDMDIGDSALLELAARFRPNAISHCAAQASVHVSMTNPRFDARVNVDGGLNVLNAALHAKTEQLIYVNTGGALYGNPEYLPCDETHPIQPISAYGLSKWTLERYLKMMIVPPMELKVLRLANIYGPRQDPNGEAGVVAIFSQRMLRGDEVTIFGDGEQTRDFLYVGDVAEAHELALRTSVSLTVNISSEKALSVNELFRMMAVEVGYLRDPVYKEKRLGDVGHITLANSQAKRLLDWTPKTLFLGGMKETLESMREGKTIDN